MDVTRNYHHDNPESAAAYESIEPTVETLRRRIVGFIAEQRGVGATSDEVEMALGLSHQTVSARIAEAKAAGVVVPNGRRRPTRSGRSAAVLITAPVPTDDPAASPCG